MKNKFPQVAGVYIFKDQNNKIIYIGKAKNLKNRISSYFANKTNDWKIRSLIEEHKSIEHIITTNEIEALLLEAQLIREFYPKFNVLLKSGNPYLYILITLNKIPKIKLVRTKKEKGKYFGPFMQKQKARKVYDYLIKTFKLEFCKSTMENGCLKYHIGSCTGNCLPDFNINDYLEKLKLAEELLSGNYKESEKFLMQKIKEHNENLEFEKSKNLVDYLENLQYIFDTIKTGFSEKKYTADIAKIQLDVKTDSSEILLGLSQLQQLLKLDKEIVTIDCFDISHMQSQNIVGSCIRFTYGLPEKNSFRKFKIKSIIEQNDYAALQEAVSRRYKDISNLPDVILIDGGKGQLGAIKKLNCTGDSVLLSLAKAEETLFAPNYPNGIKLDIKTSLGKMLIQLRDYTHHFAITYHRNLQKII